MEEEEEKGPGSCWPEPAAASPEHLHVQFHNRIKAAALERRDGSVGQVYTQAYMEGIGVYLLTLLSLTCGRVQLWERGDGRQHGGQAGAGGMCWGGRAAPGGWGMGPGRPSPPGRQPCSGLAVNLL